MTTEGIEAVFLETHNWGKSAKFFQALGYEIEFETDHNSGQLRNGDGPYVFIAEVPEDQSPAGTSCWRWPTPTRSSPTRPSRSSAGSRTPTGAQGDDGPRPRRPRVEAAGAARD